MALHKDFEAVTAATRAIDLAPSWPVGWLTLGRAQLNLGEPQLALASYERCLQLEVSARGAPAVLVWVVRCCAGRRLVKLCMLHFVI